MVAFRRFFIRHQAQVRLGQKCAPDKLRHDVVTRELMNAYEKTSPQGAEACALALAWPTVIWCSASLCFLANTKRLRM